jgi:PAS domain S-box-containing protein
MGIKSVPIEIKLSDDTTPAQGRHTVKFYDDDRFLIDAVSELFEQALTAGAQCFALATEEHRIAISARLADSKVDTSRLTMLDARETLDKFMADGQPDEVLFNRTIGSLVAERLMDVRALRCFGEMVAILWTDGNAQGAIALEEMWNRLGEKHTFTLLCAYPMSAFSDSQMAEEFHRVCGSHAKVIPAEMSNDESTEDQRSREIVELQRKAKVLEREIAYRKQAEEELRRKTSELTSFLESASVGLHWVGADGTIVWANSAEMELLGYSPSEYIGHNIAEFHEDPEVICDMLERLLRDENLKDYEARLKCKDGSIRTVLVDSSGLWEEGRFVHSQCFIRDVTDQRQSEEIIYHLAALVESCEDAVMSTDLHGFITSWNSGAERVLGYSRDDVIGKSIEILVPADRKGEEPGVINRICLGERIHHYETQRLCKNGSVIDVSLTASPIHDRTGRIVGASKVARDISAQKHDQVHLKQLAHELATANQELESRVEERTASLMEAVTQMEEFSYTVSHDLRAPLRAMDMYARVLTEDYASTFTSLPEAIHCLRRIGENCSRLDQMIRDVLTFGRVAREQIQLGPVSLDNLVADIIYHLPALQAPNACVHVEALGVVRGHEASLTQAISNLLLNAVKFVAPGAIPEVRIWSEKVGNSVRLFVADKGIGIDPDYQHRLFGLFERIHPELDYDGTGVGLAIVRKATERMGGKVGVESDGKCGSRFWIELPAS